MEGSWKHNGLESFTVNELILFDGKLYAATDQGLYKLNVNLDNKNWISLGLRQENVLSLVFLSRNKLLAAVGISDFSGGIPSLFLSDDQGESWRAYMNNFGGPTGEYTWISSIGATSKLSDTLFAHASGGVIARSVNQGLEWKVVNGQWNLWGGLGIFVKADPYHKGTVWAGGVNAFSQPLLFKSTNNGGKWKKLENIKHFGSVSVKSVCYDIVVFPNNNTILAGMGGTISSANVIRKSKDDGQSWHTVQDSIKALTLEHSAHTPTTVYASGIKVKPSKLFFTASTDFGETWQKVVWEESPQPIKVNNMISVMVEGREVLYLGTNKGVYSYTFK